jgi:hypothetical protein
VLTTGVLRYVAGDLGLEAMTLVAAMNAKKPMQRGGVDEPAVMLFGVTEIRVPGLHLKPDHRS